MQRYLLCGYHQIGKKTTMKVIEGGFVKEKKNRILNDKILDSVSKVLEIHGAETEGNYILLTEVNGEIYIASDLNAEEFNFLLDTAKLNVLYSTSIPQGQ